MDMSGDAFDLLLLASWWIPKNAVLFKVRAVFCLGCVLKLLSLKLFRPLLLFFAFFPSWQILGLHRTRGQIIQCFFESKNMLYLSTGTYPSSRHFREVAWVST